MRPGFLGPYRVLDVTDHRGLLAGHMLAQLGAEVVQMEPPGGCAARRHPPFAPGWPEGEDSLFWAAFAAGKSSIVCDPAAERELWHSLLRAADFLIDSAAPAEGRPAWLDPEQVAAINPAIVHVSTTPFGLTGPKRAWHDSEITLWAAGGLLLLTRDRAGRPLRISVPQAYLHGAATGAATDAALSHLPGPQADEDRVEALVIAWTSVRTSEAIEEAMQAIGVAVHRLVSIERFAHDPQIVERGHLVRLPHPLSGETVIEAAPFRLSRTPARYQRAAPVYGRDNRHVLETILEYDQTAIVALKACGALT